VFRNGGGLDALPLDEPFATLQAVRHRDRDLLLLSDPRIVINVNSMSEVDRVVALQLPNPIALRVNPDVGAGHHRDVVTGGFGVKFGLEIAQLADARMILADAGRGS